MAKKTDTKIKQLEGGKLYDREEDVVLEIVQTVPQPDRIEKSEIRVKDVKREIEDCDKAIADATARKAELEKILSDNKKAIKDSIQK